MESRTQRKKKQKKKKKRKKKKKKEKTEHGEERESGKRERGEREREREFVVLFKLAGFFFFGVLCRGGLIFLGRSCIQIFFFLFWGF